MRGGITRAGRRTLTSMTPRSVETGSRRTNYGRARGPGWSHDTTARGERTVYTPRRGRVGRHHDGAPHDEALENASTPRDPAAKSHAADAEGGAAERPVARPRAARMSWSSAAVSSAWRALLPGRRRRPGPVARTGPAREWRVRRLPEPGGRRSRDDWGHRLLEGCAEPTPCSASMGSTRATGSPARWPSRSTELGGRGARRGGRRRATRRHSLRAGASDRLRRLEPVLTHAIPAAAFRPDNAQVDPRRTICALAAHARRLGARFGPARPVTGLTVQHGRVTGVKTPTAGRGRRGGHAAGAWSPR